MADKVKTGRMARGEAVHVAIYTRTTTAYDGRPYRLYRPLCQRLSFKNVSYLLGGKEGKESEATCKKCLAKLTAEQIAAGFEPLGHDGQ
jgi:hypothetical protein